MKRASNLMPQVQDMDNLRLAFWKAGKGKRYSHSVRSYQEQLHENLNILQQHLQSGCVEVGDYRYFLVYEPKVREICASAFREQVLHHALMNVCHDYFEKKLIFDCYASRKEKGTYAALNRARVYTRKYKWYLKLDVRKFFASIHHRVLKQQLAKVFKEEKLLSIFYQIIDSFEATPGRGVPIGNLTSQYFANHYLSGMDHIIKEQLGIKAYVRYMDDMVLWHQDKSVLRQAHKFMEDYLASELRLELKPAQLNKTIKGLPFLGYRVFPYHTRLLQKSKQRFIKKSALILENWQRLEIDSIQASARMLPLLAFIQYSDAAEFQKMVFLHQQGQTL